MVLKVWDTRQKENAMRSVSKVAVTLILIGAIAFVEGCGSGYEINESNGRIYVQRKSLWRRMFLFP